MALLSAVIEMAPNVNSWLWSARIESHDRKGLIPSYHVLETQPPNDLVHVFMQTTKPLQVILQER